MKRSLSVLLTALLLVGTVPAHAANSPEKWQSVARQCEELGLSVTWYPAYEGLMRRYGTDRMLLVKGGQSYLSPLGREEVLAGPFDAVGEFDEKGYAVAAQNGKWGKIDQNGNTVVDFIYDTAQEAEEEVKARVIQEPGGWKYAVADMEGNRLTPYRYWSTNGAFSHGMLAVFIGEDENGNELGWGYVNEKGEEVIPCQFYQGGVQDFGEDGFVLLGGNLLDKTGKFQFSESKGSLWRANCGLYGFTERGKVGFCDKTGAVIIAPQYDYYTNPKGLMVGNVFAEKSGTAIVSLEGDSILIDTKGNQLEMGEPVSQIPYFREGLMWINADGNNYGFGYNYGTPWGFENEAGEVVVPTIFDGVGEFDRGLAVVMADGVYGLLKNPLQADACSDWAAEELARAAEQGLVTADCARYRTYSITRAQFAHLAVNYLEKTLGEPITPAPADTFTDTTDEGILKAYAAGIVQGVGEGKFSPGGLLTREQLATMLWRAMERAGAGMHIGSMEEYSDWEQVSDWAQNAMNNLVHHGVMQGTGAVTLSPKESCTVEQAILLILRAEGGGQ